MNGAPRDGQGPSHRECLLPSVARTLSATQVTPAKKITFLKRGDPRFAGVRLAVHQRTFKTFNALMDELSQRVPLAFGVRSVTTPRGLHGLNALEQLQDGGCYLCSDKQPPKTPSRLQGRSSSALQSWDPEGQVEVPGTTPSGKAPRATRRMTLVRNGDPRFRQTVVLSHRNTRNLAAFLSKASDLLHFPVKQVYTLSGKKVDSLQSLLHCPSVLVCAGNEAFRPLLMEDAARNGSEMLSGLSSRGKNGSWGPESKQSVIHARTGSGSGQARRLALLSESRSHASLHHAQRGPAPIRHPQDTRAAPGPLVAGDDVEKKVHLNEDGSLSVEMRVRFQLLGDEALLWSQRVGRAASREDCSSLGEAEPFSCTWQGAPWGSSESGARASRALEAGFHGALGHSQQPEPSYEIWRNPLYTCQGEGPAAEGRPGVAQHTRCRRRWSQGTTGRQRSLQDSASPASTVGCLENSELEFRSSSRTLSEHEPMIRKLASGELRSPSLGSVYSQDPHGYHPTPPEGRPCAKKPLRNLSHTSSGDPSADGWEADGGQQAEEKLKEGPLQLSGPGSAAVGTTVKSSLNPGTGPRGMLEVKAARIGPDLKELEDDGSMTPSALPHASPDAVVREWLGNIPEEPVLMRYEMDETSGMAREGPEGPQGSPADDQGQGEQLLLEVDISEHVAPKVEANGVLPGPSDTGTESRQASPQGQGAAPAPASDSPVEVRALAGAAGALGRASCALPGRVSASTQIMKVLMGAKPGRPSSLPELSDVVAKRLSHSAVALIACLARLHFFDKDPGSPVDKVSFTDSPQYQELLSISQTLWPRCSSGQDLLDPELQELPPHKPLPMSEDLTPTSSSGVDVSSGSGGSGEGSVPCAMDSTGVPERTEPLLKTSSPRPGSRASGHAENVEEPQPGCSAASASSQIGTYATSKQAAVGGSREQLVGNTLEQEIENVVQEDGVQLEETKEAENEEPHAGIQEQGLPMGTCLSRLGSSEAGSAGSEGSQDDQRKHKEEARPCPSDRSENPSEPSQPLSEGPSKTSDSQRGPKSDPGLEEPPTAAAAVGVSHKQAQVRPWLQLHAGEANRCTACRACLDPDPTWVSKLLKKMQMSFLTHLADATAQLRARWNLQDDGLLDQMVAELEQDLGQRLQASTDKELRKIQSRAGRRAQGSGPAWEVLRGQTSLQTEQRRHRLHGLRNLSALTDQTCGRGLFSLSLEDARSAPGEEFCPCEVCLRKKVPPMVSPREAGAPIKKAFDLQQILKKKEGCPKGETEAVATKRKLVTPKQEDPGVAMDMSNSGQGASGRQELGSDIELGAKEGDGGEGSQRFSRDKEPPAGDAEGAGGQESGDSDARGQEEELGGGQEEQRPMLKGSEDEDSLEAAALEGSSWTAGQDDGGATAAEVPGAGGGGQSGSEGGSAEDTEGSSQGHPGASQLAEASENSSPDQGRRPASSPAPQGDTPKQRPDPQPRSSSSLSAPGCVCPPAHQKGPASELPSGDRRNSSAEPHGTPPPDTRVTARCPGSSPLEQEGCPSCPRTPEQGAGYACYESQGEEVARGIAHTQVGDKADGFGQDDLDF
ncbi:retinitis pigmentosa 1-like 1 protein [Ochotona princeps]|uniref:retinitis pigmentosa 1-like 1 protein n=1 Tax=Ochotona princeps TaxID=9978 RepID=UPI002714628C|nr:retinitis pigmentosa 1-like 1 protein [Ochotona princeps]